MVTGKTGGFQKQNPHEIGKMLVATPTDQEEEELNGGRRYEKWTSCPG